MTIKALIFFVLSFFIATEGNCQKRDFTRHDSLRGALSEFRSCYDVYFYDLNLDINIPKKSISGFNKIYYSGTQDFQKIQVDLFNNLSIDSIIFKKSKLKFVRDSNAVFIDFPYIQKKSCKEFITIYYSGQPIIARHAPWDGGFVWEKDTLGNPFVGVACQGMGASSWWPCKDHTSDEPDSMSMSFTVPSRLVCISNGNLIRKESLKDKTTYTWFVSYPINNYNVTLNIGDYAFFTDSYIKDDGSSLLLDYYVLKYNRTKAQNHFEQVKKILKAYENYFGPYPFPKDGYGLVETPYWGMEHQSAISYGNDYENTLGEFDFIIAHESAHEWWGNSLTTADMGELWIHESFATYSESLLMEYYYGKGVAQKYLNSQKEKIKNKDPLLKPLEVNFFHTDDSDIYYKGAWMLHTLRNVISNDSLWFKIIHGLADNFRHSIVNTEKIISYFNICSNKNLSPIFDQYLKHSSIPILVYNVTKKGKKVSLTYKWKAETESFNMPVMIETINKTRIKICPTKDFQTIILDGEKNENIRIMAELFYIETENIKNKK
jgi:aminopeptidase N